MYDYEVVNAGTLNSLWAENSGAPGGTNLFNVTAQVRRVVAGTPTVLPALTCTTTGTARACEATGSFPLLTGDRIEVRVHETGSPGNPGNKKWKTYVTISSS